MKELVLIAGLLLANNANAKTYRAKYVECYDGDTCTFDFYLGFGVRMRQDVRLCDIDTPEMTGTTMAAAQRARDYLRDRLRKAKEILIDVQTKHKCENNRCEKMTFARTLGYVFSDGARIHLDMLNNGHAVRAEKRCK